MEQLQSFAYDRLLIGCIHCTGPTETRDHVPSRILLDEPYPENLPVVPACAACNAGFSLDEEYLACLIEVARTGGVDLVQRPKIRRILETAPALAVRLQQARLVSEDGAVSFSAEHQRVKHIVLKLARGHAAYELDEQRTSEPSHLMIVPLHTLAPHARAHFETPPHTSVWPEVGTRAMQRMVVSGTTAHGLNWVVVQPGQYRYLAIAEGPVMVRIVIGEYFACEVIWEDA
jgi:hypothetical protein